MQKNATLEHIAHAIVCQHNIVAARAVDREFNYKFGSNSGGGRRGGCAPPAPPCIPGGPAPQIPQKALRQGRSAPLAAAVGRLLSTGPLVRGSWAARGRTFFKNSGLFLKKPLVQGSCAAWGRTF